MKYYVIHNTAVAIDKPRVMEVELSEFLSALSLCPWLIRHSSEEDINDIDLDKTIKDFNLWAQDHGGQVEKLVRYDPTKVLYKFETDPDEDEVRENRWEYFDDDSFYREVIKYLNTESDLSDKIKKIFLYEINDAMKEYNEHHPLEVKYSMKIYLKKNIAIQGLNVQINKIEKIFDKTFWKYIKEHGEVSKERIYSDQWLEQNIEFDQYDYEQAYDNFKDSLAIAISETLLNNPIANPNDGDYIFTFISNAGWLKRSGHLKPDNSFTRWDAKYNCWTINDKEFNNYIIKLGVNGGYNLEARVYFDRIAIIRTSHDEPFGAQIVLTVGKYEYVDEDEDINS